MTANLPPTGLSFFDGRELDDMVRLVVVDALDHARKWKAIPPPPLFTDEELAKLTPPGEKTWTRDFTKTPPPEPFPDPPPARYPDEAIKAELAMSLYRAACRLGLHATGTEAILLASLERAEHELMAASGVTPMTPASVAAAVDEIAAAGGLKLERYTEAMDGAIPAPDPVVAEVSVSKMKVRIRASGGAKKKQGAKRRR